MIHVQRMFISDLIQKVQNYCVCVEIFSELDFAPIFFIDLKVWADLTWWIEENCTLPVYLQIYTTFPF